MRIRFVLPLIPLLLGGCKSTPTQPAALCILGARVGDVDYGQYAMVSADRVGPEFTRTTRHRDCEDVIISGQPAPEAWRNGDSSFAPNTPLYASLDEPTSDVLLAPMGGGQFVLLRRLPHPGSPAAGGQ